MTLERLWLVVLVAPLLTPSQSLKCVHLDNTTFESMKSLGSIIRSPLKCLKDIKDFEFPEEIFPYIQHVERDMKAAFYVISTQALNIFNQNSYLSPVMMERLQQIRMRLFEQFRQAEDCFMDEEKENKEDSNAEHPQPKHFQIVFLKLNKYFIKVSKFLEDKKYSFCAWKIVGAEMRRCFVIFSSFKRLPQIQSESSIFKQELRN